MIDSFLGSWTLFQNAYLAGWTIAVLLAAVGVAVVARGQIFLGAAVSQASTFGIAVAIALGARIGASGLEMADEILAAVVGVGFAVFGALLAGLGALRRESGEGLTSWLFLISASGAILVVSGSPHGLEEVHRILASSLIGAVPLDLALFGTLVAATAAALATLRRPLLLVVLDPVMAEAVGLRVAVWNAAIDLWLGLAVGLSIRVSGALYAFGCLVLPTLVARRFCRETGTLFAAAPLVALGSAVVAFVVANHLDLPPAQTTVALLALLLAAAWVLPGGGAGGG